MRIEQMRSGRAYLTKRPPTSGITSFEPREPRRSFARAPERKIPEPRPYAEPQPQIQSDLDKNQWSVVSFGGVEAGGLTYSQASRLMEVLGENGINGLCIITDAAALNID